ncbi:Hypothetical predicted protein [Pelobates cultripes]|uniref:Uncharacterized protein n=1 Tax=Pelobates cultripes TaxID=61616 RepID=A0AAD1RKW1_PELCU|nr:Hypothetical predicted protein [Pelobates cultripes]
MNIGDMWKQAHKAAGATMASLHGGCSDFSDGTSDEGEGSFMPAGAPPPPERPQPPAPTPTPVTMEAIRELMTTHHGKISAEVATIREDLKGLSARLGIMEYTSNSQIEELQAAVHDLKQHDFELQCLLLVVPTRNEQPSNTGSG